MKQHVELAIIVAMSAMMVFGAAAFVMPYVYALTSSSTGSGGSSAPGASGAAASGTKGGTGGAGDNKGSTTTGGSSTGGSSTGGSSTGGSHPTTNPPPKNPPPKTTPPPVHNPPPKPVSKVPYCNPHGCKGTPHYYTLVGHHHCYDGYPGCVCNSSRAACGANYGKP
jgi:hypothetical protein